MMILQTTRGVLASGQFDNSARSYIAAVEAADGETLEPAVRLAINSFVRGCKTDGIWDAIKASCILAGARTLSGALVPLRGTAPTNFNFVSGDYNRKTGLNGNGSTKYLDSNRNNNTDPQNSKHLSVWRTIQSTQAGLIGTNLTANGASWLYDGTAADSIRLNTNPSVTLPSNAFPATGFIGGSRASSSDISYRFSGTTSTASSTSQAPLNQNITVFRGVNSQTTSSRMTFYSIGESLDLALLDNRIATLMTDLNAAIA